MLTVLKVILYGVILVFVFGILIFIHEWGHFFTARRCKVTIKEFAVGMGPKLKSWKSKKYDTIYSIRALPIGGYVSMAGEDEESDDEGAFCNKSIPKRMLIVAAGAIMNLILGFVLMFAVVMLQGPIGSNVYSGFVSEERFQTLKTENSDIIGGYDFSQFPLKAGDRVLSVDGTRVHTYNEVIYEIMNKGYRPIDITVKRDSSELILEDVTFPSFLDAESGVTFGYTDFMMFSAEPRDFGNILKQTLFRSVSSVKMIYDSLFGMVSGRYGLNAVSGPVGVAKVMGDAATTSILSLVFLVSILTINLGVVNLLPFPALDGGRFLFLLIEGIIGRPLNKRFEQLANFIGIIILFGFMILISFKDVFKLIFR